MTLEACEASINIRGPLGEAVRCPVLELRAGRAPKPHPQHVPNTRCARKCSERDELLLRFLSKVEFVEECWLWVGGLRGGNQERHKGGAAKYGQLTVDGIKRYAHHVSHELFIGPIPAKCVVDHAHECGRGACVRPDFLCAVSLEENSRRAAALTNGAGRGGSALSDLF